MIGEAYQISSIRLSHKLGTDNWIASSCEVQDISDFLLPVRPKARRVMSEAKSTSLKEQTHLAVERKRPNVILLHLQLLGGYFVF